MTENADGLPDGALLRHPTEADQPRIVASVDQWFGSRRAVPLLSRSSFRHFAGTSWLIADGAGAPIGCLIGFVSPTRPGEAVLQVVAVDPNHRRRGLGRRLVAAFEADVGDGAARVTRAVVWPDEPIAVGFFHGLGFRPESEPGTQRLWGVPAWPDYDAPNEDRAVFVHVIDRPG